MINKYRSSIVKHNSLLNICFVFGFVVFLPLFTSLAHAGRDYNGIFTPDIYDQTAVLYRLKQNAMPEDQYNKELENELLTRKKEAIRNTYSKRAKEKLKFLDDKFQIALEAETIRDGLNEIGSMFNNAPFLGYAVGNSIGGGIGGGIGVGIGAVIQIAAKMIANSKKRTIIPSDPEYHMAVSKIAEQMQEVATGMFDYENDLYLESILPYEITYIHKKRHIKNNEGMIKEIESQLIKARMPGMPTLITDFLDRALKLPTGPKIINESLDEIEERFDNDPFFSGFESSLREKLKGIVRECVRDSRISDDTIINMRRCYYFYGLASTGKSEAAEKIAQFLGFPYLVASITQQDISSEDFMKGSFRSFSVSKVGMWAEPFLEEIDGQTYTNAFLIINDSQAILDSNDPRAKTFYTNYLDSNTKKYMNKYFNCNNSILRLTIIITSNKEMTASNKEMIPSNKGQNQTLENMPLTSRLTPLFFPQLSENTIKIDMDKYLAALQKEWAPELPNFISVTYINPNQLQVSYVQDKVKDLSGVRNIIKDTSPFCISIQQSSGEDPLEPTLRDLKDKDLKTTIDCFARQNKKEGEKFYKGAQDNDRMENLNKAALRGHPEAIKDLISDQIQLKEIELASILDNDSKREAMLMIGWLCQEIGKIHDAKNWWAQALEFGDLSNWKRILPHLPIEIKTSQDHLFLDHLLKSPKAHPEVADIGDFLSKRQVYHQDTTTLDDNKTDDCFVYSQWLLNTDLSLTLYDLGERIESKEGIGSKNAIAFYKCVADEHSRIPSSPEHKSLAQFKLGCFDWYLNPEVYYSTEEFCKFPCFDWTLKLKGYFPIENLITTDILDKVNALKKLSDPIRLLCSGNPEDLPKGLHELLGESNKPGQIETLWKTNQFAWWWEKEAPDSLGALVNRANRFSLPQHKDNIFKIHVSFVHVIACILLNLKDNENQEENFVAKIKQDSKKLKSVELFIRHLKFLGDVERGGINETLSDEGVNFLNQYKVWLGDTNSNAWKGASLSRKYF